MKISLYPKAVLGALTVMSAAAGVSVLVACGDYSGIGYTAHEWGTFTSVQGAEGKLLAWSPLESSRLPDFVYDWNKAGAIRGVGSPYVTGKASLLTLQRMETPVIYFYSARDQTVDVSVRFPQGLITEWYPQVSRIGPSAPAATSVAAIQADTQRTGDKPVSANSPPSGPAGFKESGVSWTQVRVLAPGAAKETPVLLPSDSSGSHYFAARETDANYVQVNSGTSLDCGPEHEKFLFYRGVGNFETPLRVTLNPDGQPILQNLGTEPLEHLFVLEVKAGAGSFVRVNHLLPGEYRNTPPGLNHSRRPLDRLSDQLGRTISEALTEEGLFQREALAMVKTWKDSWLEEEGLRVLYLLPRAWTDRVLPLKMDPAPARLTRVMVGRAEILSTEVRNRLAADLAPAAEGDLTARARLESQLLRLGRFAEPALRLATEKSSRELQDTAWELYRNMRPALAKRS